MKHETGTGMPVDFWDRGLVFRAGDGTVAGDRYVNGMRKDGWN